MRSCNALGGVSLALRSIETLAMDMPHPTNPALYRLTKHLLQKYHKAVRPVHDWTEATTVYLDVLVHAILDVVRTVLPLPIPVTCL